MQNRLQLLQEFYDQDPREPFNAYALALEYLNLDQSKALAFFEILLRDHPDYIPTYYHAAKLYQDLNRRDDAIRTYEKGIEICRKQSSAKALRELQSAYDELLYD
jgi:tetratricopeptide (TPR) repeat protein